MKQRFTALVLILALLVTLGGCSDIMGEIAGNVADAAVKELEAQLAEYVGVKHCITCANGTDALTLALMAWDIGEGEAVFVPDFTFLSTSLITYDIPILFPKHYILDALFLVRCYV